MRKVLFSVVAAGLIVGATALPAAACGGLVAPNGTVRLLRTTTLAGYADGIEHYVTSFKFSGAGGAFGSIVPLPGIPSSVERGGDWTLQRLLRETTPVREFAAEAAAGRASAAPAQVLLQKRIDALDITVLKGGGKAVGDWAREHGFQLTPDAPEVLDFYGERSPIFLAAQFDASAAQAQGVGLGDGTPIHLTIPTQNPWVPLRILALGRGAIEPVQADVYLLTEREPALLAGDSDNVMTLEQSGPASIDLLDDLRSDKGMEWVPPSMWLSYLRIDGPAGELRHDLAIDVDGGTPSRRAAGLEIAAPPLDPSGGSGRDGTLVFLAGLGLAVAVIFVVAVASAGRPPAPAQP